MLAEIPIGFWAFWLAAGVVLYVALTWMLIRVAVRWDERRGDAPHEGGQAAELLTDEMEGSRT